MTKINVKDFEGAVSVNADITPITRQPIDQVDSDDWSSMSIAELQAQLVTLQQRYNIAAHLSSADLMKQLQKGIVRLNLILKSKTNSDSVGLIR